MLTGFQFRAAKEVLNLTAKEITSAVKVHQGTIVRLGFTNNLDILQCNAKTMLAFIEFFEAKEILFPNKNIISLKQNELNASSPNNLTRFQLKVARIACYLTLKELSSYIKISSSSLSNIEKLSNIEYIKSNKFNISQLKKYFEHLGICFISDFSVSIVKDPIKFIKKTKIVIDAKNNKE